MIEPGLGILAEVRKEKYDRYCRRVVLIIIAL